MAVSPPFTDNYDWRRTIISRLQARNKSQTDFFKDIISLHNHLFESRDALEAEKLRLSVLYENLKLVHSTCRGEGDGCTSSDSKYKDKIARLDKKILAQQEELTELLRRKGENAQQIIDLNHRLLEKDKELQAKDACIAEIKADNIKLKAEIQMYQNNNKELVSLNSVLRDEHQALQLAFSTLEQKLRKTQDENHQLVEQLVAYKAKDAEKMNQDNENFLSSAGHNATSFLTHAFDGLMGKRQTRVQKELEDAAKEASPISTDGYSDHGYSDLMMASNVPTKVITKFDAHEGEVYAVKWSTQNRTVATGGADRKVKLWDVSKGGTVESKGSPLSGSNAAVVSLDFDATGDLVLGASNDMAARVWTTADQRLRYTYTGHSDKVMAAKFLGNNRVVSGSHDRTLKIWDLARNRSCLETKFAGSTCNDVVTDTSGFTFISGHYDKKIRFWDSRASTAANELVLQGKITSLDLSRDGLYLLACVRDDSLKMIDLRKNLVVGNYSAEGFKVGCDHTRAVFSPDAQHVAVGSADSSVFIFKTADGKVASRLRGHQSWYGDSAKYAVIAVSWEPYGNFLISVDRNKTATLWGV